MGFVLLAAFGFLVLVMWPGRAVSTYTGYVLSAVAFLILFPFASCNALLGHSEAYPLRPSRWWLLLFIPLAIGGVSVEYRLMNRAAGFRFFSVPSTSMEKMILQGDRFVADARYYTHRPPQHGDIVAFLRNNTYFVKRVIAVGGDTIQGFNGTVWLNGVALTEPYIEHIHGGSEIPELNNFGPIVVPPRQYFVMGDNRDMSYDSRSHDFGVVSEEAISGRLLYVYLPKPSGRMLR
jgi:signal peptidase I